MAKLFQGKAKHLRLLLHAANSPTLTSAVVFRCAHYNGQHGAIMNVAKAIEHWTSCRPFVVATSLEGLQLAERRN
jgi:hypothetical protein